VSAGKVARLVEAAQFAINHVPECHSDYREQGGLCPDGAGCAECRLESAIAFFSPSEVALADGQAEFLPIVQQLARFMTEEEMQPDGMSGDDAVETLSIMIERARAALRAAGRD